VLLLLRRNESIQLSQKIKMKRSLWNGRKNRHYFTHSYRWDDELIVSLSLVVVVLCFLSTNSSAKKTKRAHERVSFYYPRRMNNSRVRLSSSRPYYKRRTYGAPTTQLQRQPTGTAYGAASQINPQYVSPPIIDENLVSK
jgi:hypothetical protein